MPCHHALAEELRHYIDAAGIAEDRKGYLFRTAPGHDPSALLEKPMAQADASRMIHRRALAVGIHTPIGNHSFREPASLPISRTMARSSMRRKWPRMRARARPSSMTERKSGSRQEVERIRL